MKSNESIIFKIFETLKNCFFLINNFRKSFIFINVFVTFIQGIKPSILIIIMKNIINIIQTESNDFQQVFFLIIIYVLVQMCESIITYIYNYYFKKFNLNFSQYLDELLLKKAMKLKLKDFENSETYNIINRAQNQRGTSILSFVNSFFDIFKTVITIVSSLIILSKFNITLIAIVFIIPIIEYLYSLKMGKLQYKISVARTEKERQAWYIDFLVMTGTAFKEIELFNLKEYLLRKYTSIKNRIIKQDLFIEKKVTIVNCILNLCDYVVNGIILGYIVFSGFTKKILIGDVTAYSDSIYNAKTGIELILGNINSIVQQSLFIDLLFKFLSMKVEENDIEDKIEIDTIKSIEFIDLSYKYSGNTEYALKHINLKFESNDLVGIVGKNGSGKSTLIKVLLGFYADYEGELLVNGISLRKINKENYMSKIGCVFQDYIKYETSLRENVGMGYLDHIDNDNKLYEALKYSKTNLEYFEDNGLDTMLGVWFGQKQLSIGEWQRIAIARALLKDADIYVLDEPDASLDSVTERELLLTYKEMFKNKIGIMISHKIRHIQYLTNKIIVLEGGTVVEQGSHKDLINKKGAYQNLFSSEL